VTQAHTQNFHEEQPCIVFKEYNKQGMIVDVDHMGCYALMDTLDILEQRQYSGVVSSHGWVENSEVIRKRIFGIGIGSNIQGVTTQTDADPEELIRYPFASFDGLVSFTPRQTGNHRFNYKTEGMANCGLLAEWVENMRQVDQEDSEDLLEILMNSAEAYLQMWRCAQAAAVE
jgi:hypothetical protein